MIILGLRILNQLMLGSIFKSKILKGETGPSVSLSFRAWPIDLDFNWHLNNASYLKTAELARWRVLQSMVPVPGLKTMPRTFWLLADSNIQYLKPIAPFAKYNIRTELQYESATDKWFHFTHTFVHPEKSDVVYAVIKARMVVKEPSGKTIRCTSIIEQSKLIEEYVTKL